MILVKTYVDKSLIQGLGLFANEDIKRGTIVYRFVNGLDQIFDKSVLKKYNNELFDFFFNNYGFELYPDKIYVDLDHGRYTNHSDSPNLTTKYSGMYDVHSYANRDIKKGEEITMSYLEIEPDLRLLSGNEIK